MHAYLVKFLCEQFPHAAYLSQVKFLCEQFPHAAYLSQLAKEVIRYSLSDNRWTFHELMIMVGNFLASVQ